MVYRNRLVEIPEDKTYVQVNQKTGNVYVYMYTHFYRNADGKARNESKSIGIKASGNMMYPNDNYYRLCPEAEERIESDVLNVGFTSVVQSCFQELGLSEILDNVFGSKCAARLRAICSYIVKEGCVMSYIDDFTEKEFFTSINEIISSQIVSDVFAEITNRQMLAFYSNWIPKVVSDGYICYDITSISTYSRMITEAEYGYNRDHDQLPQLNLGLFTSEDTGYPVYMVTYNGSVNDKSDIVYACENARAAGLNKKFLAVMDGGFFDSKKLQAIYNEGITFTVGMPAYLNDAKTIISTWGNDLYDPKYLLSYSGTYGKMIDDVEIFGIKGRVFIGLCTESREFLNDDLSSKIYRYREEIEIIAKYSTVIKHKKYTDLFDFVPNQGDNGFTYSLNKDKEIAARRNFGYFAIFTTDMKATADDIIKYYREKDLDEKMFYDIKVYMNGRHPRIHSQSRFEGKYFAVFLALILRTWLKQKLHDYKTAHHLTLKRCLMKLSDVRIYQDERGVRYLKSLTAEQRTLLNLCGVDEKVLETTCRKALTQNA